MQEQAMEARVTAEDDLDGLADISRTENADQLAVAEALGGFKPLIVQFSTSEERYAIRDRNINPNETSSLFASVAQTHPLEEEHEDDEEEHEDDEGNPVSAYQTAYALWALKTGKLKTKKAFGHVGSRVKWSRIFRAPVVHEIAKSRGWALREPQWAYLHPTVQRMAAMVQWEADIDGSGLFVPVDVSIVGGSERWKWMNSVGEFIVPATVMLRVQHILSVTGCARAAVIGFFGGSEERIFFVERDEAIIEAIEAQITDFWEVDAAGLHPPVDYDRDGKIIQLLNIHIDPQEVKDWRGNNEAKALVAQRAKASKEARELTKEAKRIGNLLQEMMGTASAADLGDAILGATVIEGGEVKYLRDPQKRLVLRKAKPKHAGNGPKKGRKKADAAQAEQEKDENDGQ